MAGTRFSYVKTFELPDPLLPETYMVLRLDGHGFHKFSDTHGFAKPNDERALQLMDAAAAAVMDEFRDVVLAFGESDEFSFLLRKKCTLYNRRQSKILSTLVSFFTSVYVLRWPAFFPDTPLLYPPSFDGRIVLYPAQQHVRDYFAWRQADTHINNLYNTTFWALVQQGGQSTTQAHETLKGTVASGKNEMLFSRFGINYAALPARFRKGSVLVREVPKVEPELDVDAAGGVSETDACQDAVPPTTSAPSKRQKKVVVVLHEDIIENQFWDDRPELLA
ncbi:tRNAHis guanylyltransferase [Auricularia subglabra TFB-10046 SS5]|uniref:tRNA(His) guanylyltransferase n=1 Tax=Auricularia subglabra (strain TFB-10046 / SS5) TaxID=717982 RepID=J0DBR1_AURST|nr:tRNAHis guanylyltransferase [Auricularia subglabra TFB-10046 SS5]